MKKNIQIDINHIVSHESTHLERVGLLKQILYDDMTYQESLKILKEILADHLQTEQEFEQRQLIIDALSALINKL